MSLTTTVGETAKPLVAGLAGVLVMASSSYEPLYYIASSLINACLSKAIKEIVRQPRPYNSPKDEGGYGMPSSHAQTLSFFLTVLSRIMLMEWPYSYDNKVGNIQTPAMLTMLSSISIHFKYGIILLLTLYAGSASFWRVSTKLHTLLQTFVGAAIGSGSGYIAHLYRPIILGTDTSSTEVPFQTKIVVCVTGACILYFREGKKLWNTYKKERLR
jgi:membrane-associated phospholipid phosphatase